MILVHNSEVVLINLLPYCKKKNYEILLYLIVDPIIDFQ
jgi:hypothetical protein